MVLLISLQTFLTACDLATSDVAKKAAQAYGVPAWPVAGRGVAEELGKACPVTIDESGNQLTPCPHLYAWLGRLHKYKKELEVKPK